MSSGGGRGGGIRLTGSSGATIVIGDGVDPFKDSYDFVDFAVSISAEGLSAKTLVRSMEGSSPRGLHRYLRELADDWKGTQPDREWEAIEHGLTIDAHRDSLGHVLLTFSLRESYRPDAWLVRATVQVDAGEEMSTLAREVERLPGVWASKLPLGARTICASLAVASWAASGHYAPVDRDLTDWERAVLRALASPDLEGGEDVRQSLPHLVVTGGCGCGCASFNVTDVRYPAPPHELSQYSNGVSANPSAGSCCGLVLTADPSVSMLRTSRECFPIRVVSSSPRQDRRDALPMFCARGCRCVVS